MTRLQALREKRRRYATQRIELSAEEADDLLAVVDAAQAHITARHRVPETTFKEVTGEPTLVILRAALARLEEEQA